jgi:hypothetical protein
MSQIRTDKEQQRYSQMGSWQPLMQASGNLILAVDFGATDRTEAGFPDLAALLSPRRTIWETRQPPAGPELSTDRNYVAWWLEGLPHQDSPVDAVLGYCVGSVFAAAIASEIELRQGRAPLLVFFDPEPPTRGRLLRDFDSAIDQLAPMLADQEQLRLHDAAGLALDASSDFSGFCSALVETFSAGVASAFAGLEVGPKLTAELMGSFSSYISYVSAAYQPALPESWPTATAIISRTPRDWVELPSEQVHFDVDSADLLRDAGVARAVSEILNRGK